MCTFFCVSSVIFVASARVSDHAQIRIIIFVSLGKPIPSRAMPKIRPDRRLRSVDKR